MFLELPQGKDPMGKIHYPKGKTNDMYKKKKKKIIKHIYKIRLPQSYNSLTSKAGIIQPSTGELKILTASRESHFKYQPLKRRICIIHNYRAHINVEGLVMTGVCRHWNWVSQLTGHAKRYQRTCSRNWLYSCLRSSFALFLCSSNWPRGRVPVGAAWEVGATRWDGAGVPCWRTRKAKPG